MKRKSYIFLGDIIDLNGLSTFKLCEDYKLKRATKQQIKYIKEYLDRYIYILNYNINNYEYKSERKNNNEILFVPLPEKDWNYWIIEHNALQMNEHFPLAIGLSKLDLTILFEGSYTPNSNSRGRSDNPLTTVNYFIDNNTFTDLQTKVITSSDQSEISHIYKLHKDFVQIEKEYDFIKKCLLDFLNLGHISKRSPFHIIGYFSILEQLLTTSKHNTTNYNSINKQLQKKVNLLNNQFENKIEISEYFKGPDTNTIETIISKMYQYRNNIAHGNKSDFENELKLIRGNQSKNILFLRNLVKVILIQSLKEPQLIKDLKEC